MLMRWYYDEEPGRGFSHADLTRHMETCNVCIREQRTIAQQDRALREVFETELVRNAELAGASREADAALAAVEQDVSEAAESEDNELTENAMDWITILNSQDEAVKTKALVRSLQRRLAIHDPDQKIDKVRALSTIAKDNVKLTQTDFTLAMKERSRPSARYPATEALRIVAHLLADPEVHIESPQPIVSLDGDDVIVNWSLWNVTAVPIPNART